MSFMNWLDKAGHDALNFFTKAEPAVAELQVIATPFENVYAPGLSQVINVALQQIINVQALATAAGKTTGSNEVKLAAVVSALVPQIAPTLNALHVVPPSNADYDKFISAIVTAANVFQFQTDPTPVVSTNPTPAAPLTGSAV